MIGWYGHPPRGTAYHHGLNVHDNDTLELPPPVRKQVRRGGSSYYMIYIITVSLSIIIEYWRLTSL